VTQGTDSATPKASDARMERRRRGRVLLALAVAALLYTLLRFTFAADINEPPHVWTDRPAWWLPKNH